jgi:5-methylcytosine-specific restriction endonuclease McrA
VRCKCQAARKADADKRRPNATQRGYDGNWQKARAAFLNLHPRCAMCGAAARVVDHIIPHHGDMRLFWDRKNWQSLCFHCHNSKKQRLERAS